MKRQVVLRPAAQRGLRKLPRDDVARLRDAMRSLADRPIRRGVKKLIGRRAFYRIRVGGYRIIYSIEDDRILIEDIGHRREIYR